MSLKINIPPSPCTDCPNHSSCPVLKVGAINGGDHRPITGKFSISFADPGVVPTATKFPPRAWANAACPRDDYWGECAGWNQGNDVGGIFYMKDADAETLRAPDIKQMYEENKNV